MRVATFNLYQFCPPPTYWYERFDGKDRQPASRYTTEEWATKTAWIAEKLDAVNADLVAFQEVFDPVALQALVRDHGYEGLVQAPGASVTTNIDSTGALVASGPIVALAFKKGFRPACVTTVVPSSFALDALGLPADFAFARTPLLARIPTPDLGDISVLVLHLKSKSVRDVTPLSPTIAGWDAATADQLRHLSRGRVIAAEQRGAEAALVFHQIANELLETKNAQIIVLGDLNDTPDSVPLEALTVPGNIYKVGDTDTAEVPQGTNLAAILYRFRLANVFGIKLAGVTQKPPVTHIHDGKAQVVDYVLVSNALNTGNGDRVAEIFDRAVLSDHLALPNGAPVGQRRITSDHGIVVAEFVARAAP